MKHIFLQWLKDKGIYEMFRDNFLDKNNTIGLSTISKPENYIDSSFVWHDTLEKACFWYEVHKQWHNHLRNLRLKSL